MIKINYQLAKNFGWGQIENEWSFRSSALLHKTIYEHTP